jgi:hypothetical protein
MSLPAVAYKWEPHIAARNCDLCSLPVAAGGSCPGFHQIAARFSDRYYRLVGEGFDQFDLLLGKRPDESTEQMEHANRGSPLAQEWHSERRAITAFLLSFK